MNLFFIFIAIHLFFIVNTTKQQHVVQIDRLLQIGMVLYEKNTLKGI